MSKTRNLFESFQNNLNESQGRKLSFEEYKDLYDPYCNLTDDELYSMWQIDKDKLYTDEEIEQIKSEVEGFFDMEESALKEDELKNIRRILTTKFMPKTDPDAEWKAEVEERDRNNKALWNWKEKGIKPDFKVFCYNCGKEIIDRDDLDGLDHDLDVAYCKDCWTSMNESEIDGIELSPDEELIYNDIMNKDYDLEFDYLDNDEQNEYLEVAKSIRRLGPEEAFIDIADEVKEKAKENHLETDLLTYVYLNLNKLNESALNERERIYKKGDTVYWIGAGNEISAEGQIIDFPDKERMTIKWDDGEVNTYSIGHPDIEHEDDYTELEPDLNENVDYNNCVYQLVGGDYAGTYTREEAEKLPIKEDKLSPNYSEYRNNGGVVPREELDDQLQFKGYLGPMYNGTDKDGKHIIRYETQEVYDMMSESALNEKYSYKEVLEKELAKVQDWIANAAPDKNISGLEDKRDWLMWKLDQLDEGDSLEKVRKDSIEKGLLSEDYNPLNIKLFMNTWGNYNVNGADVDSIGGGWMDIEQAKDFLEKHSDEEPFINDVDGDVPFEINEYSNVEQVIEWLEAYENLSDNEQDTFAAIMEDQNDDFESAMSILESGDYVFFAGVDNEEDLGRAWVDMVGGIEGVSNPENYVDEDAYRESWREAAESSVREDNPDIDEDSDEFENLVEEWLNSVVDEQLQLDIDEGRDLSEYFDYEALGNDLYNDGFFFANTGAIQTL